MRTLLRALLAALLALAALAAALPWLLLEAAPRVDTAARAPDADALQRLRQLLQANDPRRLPPGREQVLRLDAAELDLLAGQAARLVGGAARVQLTDGGLALDLSLPWAGSPLARWHWLNASLALRAGPDGTPVADRLALGRLPLPGALAGPLLQAALARWDPGTADRPPLRDMLHAVRLQPDGLELRYAWRVDALPRIAAWLLPPPQRERLRAHQARLAALTREGAGPLSLPALLAAQFGLARARSEGADEAEAAAENRAALTVLALYVTGRSPSQVLPGARAWPRARWRPVAVLGRDDFPQHLLVSAALAATADGALADALGLAKEVSDAREGSGFSFNDLALNRAGTRLGELAVQAPRPLQARLAAGVPEAALVPDVTGLPEFLPQAEFERRYGGVGAPAYERLVAEIEARVAALPLLR